MVLARSRAVRHMWLEDRERFALCDVAVEPETRTARSIFERHGV